MIAALNTLEVRAADSRFDAQLDLVREHWGAVRCLWLGDSDLDPGADIRSQLPPEFWLSCGMPGLANIKATIENLFEFVDDGIPAVIVPACRSDPKCIHA